MNVGYCIGVKSDDLASHFTSNTGWTYMLLQGPGDIWFTWFKSHTSWADWDQGVVFGKTAEMRWRKRRGGLFHLVLVTTEELPAGFKLVGTAKHIETKSVYLWGERVFTPDDKPTATWVEGRIPQIINDPRGYPLNTRPNQRPCRVALEVEILELLRPASTSPGHFDPTPPRRLERYLRVVDVPGGSS